LISILRFSRNFLNFYFCFDLWDFKKFSKFLFLFSFLRFSGNFRNFDSCFQFWDLEKISKFWFLFSFLRFLTNFHFFHFLIFQGYARIRNFTTLRWYVSLHLPGIWIRIYAARFPFVKQKVSSRHLEAGASWNELGT